MNVKIIILIVLLSIQLFIDIWCILGVLDNTKTIKIILDIVALVRKKYIEKEQKE